MTKSTESPRTSLQAFLFTDIVGSTDLKRRMGDAEAAHAIEAHNAAFRECVGEFGGVEQDNAGDGFFATFPVPSAALKCALAFQTALAAQSVKARVGIHMGEVVSVAGTGHTQKPVGLAVDTAARVMGLATGNQILITRHAFDSARQQVLRGPGEEPLVWRAHGAYRFKGLEDPIEIHEAGIEGIAPLAPPPDSEKARRAIGLGEEETLGWRPSAGLDVPGRPGWRLDRKLGSGGFGEVWLATSERTKQHRAFKFCFQTDRLRSLKRELTLFRLLQEALGERVDIARLYDVRFDEAPFFLEMEYTPDGSLDLWAVVDGHLADMTLEARAGFVAEIAEALGAAHSVGVLHKDVKPSNVLVRRDAKGGVHPRLTDFGIGHLLDPSALSDAMVSATGFTQAAALTDLGSRTGTRLYMAPELLAGKPPSIASDVHALGVLLYQVIVGDLDRPLGQGWQRDVSDALLVEDIAACVAGDPKERLASCDLLATRLRSLEARRAERAAEAQRAAAEMRRARALRVTAVASVVLVVVSVAGAWGWVQRSRATSIALQRELETQQRAAADSARAARNAEAVSGLLDQCEDALRAGAATKAQVALDAARKRSAEGGGEQSAERLERLAADLAAVSELNAVDQFRWSWTRNRFADPAEVAKRTEDALARFGADPEAVSVEDAAARVAASVVRERIVAALDRRLRQGRSAGVHALLRRVDADPYRDAVRDAVLAGDRPALVRLAAQPDAMEQPSWFAAILGESDAIAPERRREFLLAAVMRRPDDLDLLMALGTVSYHWPTDPVESAVQRMRWFQAAVAAAPDNLAALNDLGGALATRGESDAAIGCFERAISLDPTVANAHANLGNVLRNMGRLDEAIECCRKAVELAPAQAIHHSNLGLALLDRGQPDEALDCFDTAIALDPRFGQSYAGKGLALTQVGRQDEAEDCFRAAIELEPRGANAYFNLSALLMRRGRMDEAIALGRQAVELAPEDVVAHVGLGTALRAAGRVDEAIAVVGRASELHPRNVDLLLQRGAMLCDDKRDYAGALACFEKAASLAPPTSVVLQHLGTALANMGRLDEAIAAFRQAVEVNETHAWARYSLASALAMKLGKASAAGARSDSPEQSRVRREALDALRAGLALYAEQVTSGSLQQREAAQQEMGMWLREPDLACVRDAAALADLPADEQAAFAQHWADMAALNKGGVPEPRSSPGTAGAAEGDTALAFLEATFRQRQAELGRDHVDTMDSMFLLASAHQRAGDQERARPLFEDLLGIAERKLGSDDPTTMAIRSNLAVTYWLEQRLDRSIPLFETVLKYCEATSGPDHPDTLMAKGNLGVNYCDAGRLTDALPLFVDVQLAVGKYPQLGWVTERLFVTLLRVDPEIAVKNWAVLVPALQKDPGPDDPTTLVAMNNYGYALSLCRRLAEAETMLLDAIEREVRVFGEGHTVLLRSRVNLGSVYVQQKQPDRALDLLRGCVKELEERDPGGLDLAKTRSLLGRALAEKGEFEEAASLLQAAVEGLRDLAAATPDWDLPRLPEALQWLVELYEAAGDPEEALKWRRELEAISK